MHIEAQNSFIYAIITYTNCMFICQNLILATNETVRGQLDLMPAFSQRAPIGFWNRLVFDSEPAGSVASYPRDAELWRNPFIGVANRGTGIRPVDIRLSIIHSNRNQIRTYLTKIYPGSRYSIVHTELHRKLFELN